MPTTNSVREPATACIAPDDVTGIVLCGGQGRRFGGIDKPLVRVNDRRLLDHALERLAPQVYRIVLSVSAIEPAYREFGCQLVADEEAGEGPLAGLVSAFRVVKTKWALTLPGDTPRPAPSLVQRLAQDALARGVAVAHDGRRRQNLTMLIDEAGRDALTQFYRAGGRAVHRWFTEIALPSSDLSGLASSFININTPDDLAVLQCQYRQG